MGAGSREQGLRPWATLRERKREEGENSALLNNAMILRVGALSNGRVNRPWVAPLEWACWWNGHQAWKRCSAVLGRQCGLGGSHGAYKVRTQVPHTEPCAMSDCIKTLASCQFHAYFPAGRMPTLLLFIPKFSNAENPSLLLTPYFP